MISDQLFFIIPILIPIIVLSVFVYYYLGSREKLQMEQGQEPLLEEQCGGRFDGCNYTIPFVRHALYDNFIVISYGKKKIILKYEDLKKISFKRYIISNGITYFHSRQELPSSIIVWTVAYNEALNIFKQKGVPIET